VRFKHGWQLLKALAPAPPGPGRLLLRIKGRTHEIAAHALLAPVLLMCWGLLGACASLPDVQDLSAKVAPAATMSKLAKRWPKAALEEAATGEP
jgi:hypothetical protein